MKVVLQWLVACQGCRDIEAVQSKAFLHVMRECLSQDVSATCPAWFQEKAGHKSGLLTPEGDALCNITSMMANCRSLFHSLAHLMYNVT